MEPQAQAQTPLEKIEARYPEAAALFGAQTILDVPRDFGEFVSAPDVFTVLAYQRLEEAGAAAHQVDAVQLMAEALVQEDPLTGFDKPHYKELNLLLAQAEQKIAAERGEELPVFYLGCDVSNLRGLNLALSGSDVREVGDHGISGEGRQNTNQFLRLFAGIVERETRSVVEEVNAAGGNAQVNFYRDGGDELSAIITGVSEPSAMEIKNRINRNVEDVVMGAGLDNLLHPKHPYMGDRAGVGLACSMAAVMSDSELEALGLGVDAEIEKLRTAKKGKKSTKPLRTNLDEIAIQKAMDAAREKAAEMDIDLTGQRLGNPFPFETLVPPELAGLTPDEFTWPQQRREWQTQQAIKDYELTGDAKEVMNGLLSIYESRDPVTGCDRHSPMAIYSDGIDFLNQNPNADMVGMLFELQNMTGLNKEKGHSGCDEMVGKLCGLIDMPGAQVVLHRPDGRGDRVYALVRGASPEDIASSVGKLNAATDVVTAVNGLSKLENIRYPEQGYEGVQFVTAAVSMDAVKSPRELFQQLDGQIRDNKANQVRFNGQGIGVSSSEQFVNAKEPGNQRTALDGLRIPPYVTARFGPSPGKQGGGAER